MKLRHIFLILLLLFPCAGFGQNDSDIITAVQKYSDGDLQGAAAILKTITDKESDNDAAWYYRGMCELSLGNEDGLTMMSNAAGLDSTNYWYRERLAIAYQSMGKIPEAIGIYEKLLKSFPKKTDVYFSLASLYMGNKEPEKAIKAISEIETSKGKTDGTVMTKFSIYQQLGRNEEAYQSLEEYCKEYSSPYVLSILGDYQMGMYNDSIALNYYNAALALDKDYPPARLGIAESYRMTRKMPEYFSYLKGIVADQKIPAKAKADYLDALLNYIDARFAKNYMTQLDSVFSESVSSHPGDTALMQASGLWYYRSERQEKAKELFQQKMNIAPDDMNSAIAFLQVLYAMGDWKELAQEGVKAYERFPKEPGFIEMANTAEYQMGNYHTIIENCNRIISASGGDSTICLSSYSTIGDMYHLLGNSKQAYKAYDKALKIKEDYVPVLNNYAYYLSEEGKKLAKAYKMSKKTIELEPGNATYLDTFAWILHLMGRDVEAKPFFKHAMLYGGKDSAVILNHYATVLEELGESSLAEVYRKQAREKEAEGKQ